MIGESILKVEVEESDSTQYLEVLMERYTIVKLPSIPDYYTEKGTKLTEVKNRFIELKDMNFSEIGIPDLLVYNKEDYCFIELKSPRDGLRVQQMLWFVNHPNLKKKVVILERVRFY